MKDAAASIRTLYTTLLAGITYGGKSVPFYDGEPYETTPENYIFLQSTSFGEDNNDQHFVSEGTVTLQIVTKQNMRNSKDACDGIASSVLGVLLPHPFVDRFDADFQIQILSAGLPGDLHSQDGTVHINRKILTINHRINQMTNG
jgi:hypothetical protein